MKKILFFLVPLVLILAILLFVQVPRTPVLTSMNPRIGGAGDILILEGRNFGDTRGDVYIAGQRLTQSSYLEWSNSRISLRLPDELSSGMVAVENRQGVSNTFLFAQRSLVPVALTPISRPDERRPEVNLTQVRRGQEFQITGSQIGPFPLGDRVVWQLQNDWEIEVPVRRWEASRITLVVPIEAESGVLSFVKAAGERYDFPMVVLPPRGLGLVQDPEPDLDSLELQWTLSYGVLATLEPRIIENQTKSPSFGALSRLPLPRETSFQRFRILQIQSPQGALVTEAQERFGTAQSRVSFTSGLENTSIPWIHRVEVELSTLERRFNFVDSQILSNYGGLEEISRPWLSLDSPVLALSEEDQVLIAQTARTIVGRQTNPLVRSRLLYYWIMDQLKPIYVPRADFPDLGALFTSLGETGQSAGVTGSLGYSGLLVGLLRGIQIPSRIIEGFLVLDYEELVPHFWVEVLLPEIGWIPMDPGFADGMYGEQQMRNPNPRGYYFGNLDSRRVDLGPLGIDNSPSPPGALELKSWYFQGRAGLFPGREQLFTQPKWILPVAVSVESSR